MNAKQWINFVRIYGPIPTKDNLYDENLRRHARRHGIRQILFEHPFEKPVLDCFEPSKGLTHSVILTGTAGDGKTFLCGRVWEVLGGSVEAWSAQEPYCSLEFTTPANAGGDASRHIKLHVIRDLSAWVPPQGAEWPNDKRELLLRFCRSLHSAPREELFLIAANDGQLTETFRRLLPDENAQSAINIIDDLLFLDRVEKEGTSLKLFNLSRGSSVVLLERALDAFLNHEGWSQCYSEASATDQLFGSECPVRRNYELLRSPLVRERLRHLFELCDQNGLHIPVRQILILLVNGVLGHEKSKDYLLKAGDIADVVASNTRSLASLYNNLFGGNLPDGRREGFTIFSYLERFQIGHATSNRIDNMLIFGESHQQLQEQFDRLIGADTFYGADAVYGAARRDYIEGVNEETDSAETFLRLLVRQRRALFFKVTNAEGDDISPWDLTVFKFAGEYLKHVLEALRNGQSVRRSILGRLIRGANRIFTGMLINSEHELLLASSASLSQARVSRFIDERISVVPRYGGESVDIIYKDERPQLEVSLASDLQCAFELTLTRYEYLSQVAEGAMPASFSKECFEDIMAFKGRLMRELARRAPHDSSFDVVFRVLEVDVNGQPREERIGFRHDSRSDA